jgi:hypothetical protein
MIGEIIPVLGVLTGLIVPLAVFIWLYHDEKGKREAVIEIAKHLDDPAKVERLLGLFDERKKAPIDYRRGGVITLFVGVGIYLLGAVAFGNFFEGGGLLVGAIGVGTMIAGYLYPNTGEELTDAVEDFEKR